MLLAWLSLKRSHTSANSDAHVFPGHPSLVSASPLAEWEGGGVNFLQARGGRKISSLLCSPCSSRLHFWMFSCAHKKSPWAFLLNACCWLTGRLESQIRSQWMTTALQSFLLNQICIPAKKCSGEESVGTQRRRSWATALGITRKSAERGLALCMFS